MISTVTYNGDGATRIFPVAFEILGEEYIVVFIDGTAVSDKTKYDIINNSIVFNVEDAPPLGTNNVEIVVASSPTEIADLNAPPSTIQTVADNLSILTDISSTIVPNIAEILEADTNAIIATTKAAEALTSATNASLSEGSALSSKNAAKLSEVNAATSESNALLYKNDAELFKNTATTKASEANASATAAYNAQLAAEAVFDNFDDKYLGAKATEPTVDNDGNPLVTGALYFRTTAPKGIYVYDAELSSWSIFSYIPTSHGTLSGRSETDSHPMSAIAGLVEALADKLSKTLDASIDGIKTFLKFPITPSSAPTLPYQVANKKYVDDALAVSTPCFSAYRASTTQSISSSTYTKVQFQMKEYDKTSDYDNVTNFRFQPKKAGKYLLTTTITFVSNATTRCIIFFNKNGVNSKKCGDITTPSTSSGVAINGSALIELNGTTDYVEVYAYCVGSSPFLDAGDAATFFQAFLAQGN